MTQNSISLLSSFALLFTCALPTWGQDSKPKPGAEPKPGVEVAEIPATQPNPQPGSEVRYRDSITIEGSPDFVRGTVALLDSLAQLPSGKELLRELGETGYATRISMIPFAGSGPFVDAVDRANALFTQEGIELRPGSGSDTRVFMDPDLNLEGVTPEIALGHELIHALNMQRGELDDAWRPNRGIGLSPDVKVEELRVIGVADFDHERFTENRLREEWNQLHPDRAVPPARNGHGLEDFGPSLRTEVILSPRPQTRAAPAQGLSQALGGALEDE
tara:strand:+ start:418 stop:1242 length:825 start_codon:yes stop_codon:yes gene_type:complete